MVKYVLMYETFVDIALSSEYYLKATNKEKIEIEEWLESKEVKGYFGNKAIPQLELHESIYLASLNSSALQQRPVEEQLKVKKFLGSESFKTAASKLEKYASSFSF